MPLTVAQLVARLTADTSGFYRGMAIANSSMLRSGGIISRVSAGAGLAVLGMGIMSLRAAGNFQESMNVLQAVSHATTGEMGQMRDEAIKLGADLKLPNVSAKDAAEAMTNLAKGGLSVNQIMGAVRGTLQLGLAANVGFADSAVIVARSLTAFHLKGGQAAKIADLFAAAANSTTAEITDLALGVQMASAQFYAGDQSIQTLTTALGMMADAGIVGSDAGTSLKTMMNRLMAPTKKSKELMQDLGISIYDSAGNMRQMPDLINRFGKALGGQSKEQRNANLYTIFGSDAIRAARVVLLGGTDTWNSYSKEVNRAGEAQRITEARTKGFNGAIQAFGSAVETLAIQLGTAMLPAATDAARGMTSFVNSIDPNKIIATFTAVANLIEGMFNLATGSSLSSHAIQVLAGALIAYGLAMKTAATATALMNTALIGGAANAARLTFGILASVRSFQELIVAVRLLGAAFMSSMGIFGIAAAALGALATVLFLNSRRTSEVEEAYKRATSALYGYITATHQAKSDHLSFKEAQLAVKQSVLDVARATQNLIRVQKDDHSTSLDVRQAKLQLSQAMLGEVRARNNLDDAAAKNAASQKKATEAHERALNSVRNLQRDMSSLGGRIRDTGAETGKATPRMQALIESMKHERAKVLVEKLDDLAKKAAIVAAENRKAHPQISHTAATIRDQALATADLTRKLGTVPTAVSNTVGAAHSEAVRLGLSITTGVISGLGTLASQAMNTVSAAVTSAIDAGARSIKARSPSKLAAEKIGKPISDGIIMGYLSGARDLPEKIKASLRRALEAGKAMVESYQGKYHDAFGRLADKALNAFDAMTDAHLTPTEQFISAQEAAFQKADLEGRVTEAEKALQEARESGDPEAILQAERDLARARWELTKLGLEAQAAEERKQYEAERQLQREHLEAQLAQLEEKLAKHPGAWKAIMGQIDALLAKNGITMKTAGAVLGQAFAAGMWESRHDIVKAAKALARLIARILKLNSPAKEGPLSDLNKWWKPFAQTLLQGVNENELLNGLYGMVGTPRPSALGTSPIGPSIGVTRSRQSAGVVVNINGLTLLSGDRRAARQLADTLGPFIDQRVYTH